MEDIFDDLGRPLSKKLKTVAVDDKDLNLILTCVPRRERETATTTTTTTGAASTTGTHPSLSTSMPPLDKPEIRVSKLITVDLLKQFISMRLNNQNAEKKKSDGNSDESKTTDTTVDSKAGFKIIKKSEVQLYCKDTPLLDDKETLQEIVDKLIVGSEQILVQYCRKVTNRSASPMLAFDASSRAAPTTTSSSSLSAAPAVVSESS